MTTHAPAGTPFGLFSNRRFETLSSRGNERHDAAQMKDRVWHPWLRIQRLIRSILEVRRDEVTRPVLKATLTKALRERENIRRDGWMN